MQSLKNLLGELGVNVPPNVNPQLKNVAAVAIHAELPPFAKPGQPIDITVSSIGNAVAARRFAADARCAVPTARSMRLPRAT